MGGWRVVVRKVRNNAGYDLNRTRTPDPWEYELMGSAFEHAKQAPYRALRRVLAADSTAQEPKHVFMFS